MQDGAGAVVAVHLIGSQDGQQVENVAQLVGKAAEDMRWDRDPPCAERNREKISEKICLSLLLSLLVVKIS